MSETKPRDLTAEELALLRAPAARVNESAPLPIPPGTQIAIDLLNPGAGNASLPAAPTAGPDQAVGFGGSGATPGTAPVQKPPED